jgi:Acylphosphatases
MGVQPPGGSVEVAAEGNSVLLDQLRDALRRGPSVAVVTSVDDLEPLEELHDHPFAITR